MIHKLSFRNVIFTLTIFALALASCVTGQPEPPAVTEFPDDANPAPYPYPAPVEPAAPSAFTLTPYPEPGDESRSQPDAGEYQVITEFATKASDESWNRGMAYIDKEQSALAIAESAPVQIFLTLRGTLPDPCHELRVVVSEPDEKNNINIEVYSVADPALSCIQVVVPFEASVPLGSYDPGHYQVLINGELFSEFDA